MTRFIPVSLIAVLAACAHAPPPAPEQKPEPVAQPAPPPPAAPAPAPAPPVEMAKPAPPAAALAASVYFAFDKDILTKASRATLDGLATQASGAGARVRIEGNCDERGSTEYNIGLGQRRADAAKKYLVGLGVPADSIETLSWGKERPKAIGHDPASWRENRRDDVFITPAPALSLR